MQKSGFTLFELTIALSLTSIVLAMAGTGLTTVLRFNQQAMAAHNSRSELQRTMDFMATEIRMAERISPCPEIHPPDYLPATNSKQPQPILVLSMPASSGLTQPIVYYLAAPPARSVWSGPLALYRWGPTLRLNGNYSTGPAGVPDRYYNEVVVDRLATTTVVAPCDGLYSQPIPLRSQAQGFSVCSDPTGRSMRLSLQRHADQSQKVIALNAVISRRSQAMAAASVSCPA